ncbi:MAG TPA: OpgC domain-containing protein [Terriglobales bacterium]|nr:OpgC domain-containing protein [Terriglobales bacterium]
MKTRIEELDALRGLMLVWMTCTHLPTNLSTYINQPFGYFAATEGFIFLSALFSGRICAGIVERRGESAMCRNMWMRALRLYGYQLLLLAFAFVIEAPIAARGNRPAVHNLLNYYFTVGRSRAFLHSALMIYRPPLLDILPIYIIFLALTPVAILVALRFGWKYVFTACFGLWLLAQIGFQNLAYAWLARVFDLKIPLSEMGAFNLWGWQLWWLIGLWLGVRWSKGDLRLESWARKFTVPTVAVFVFFLVLRYVQLETNLDFGRLWPLFDKWNFGVVRLLDFTAVLLLVVRVRSFFKPLAIRPLVMMGQASLPVFCVHLLLVFSALTFMGSNSGVYGWRAVVLVVGSLSALLITAIVVVKRRQRAATSGAQIVQLKVEAPRAT